MCNGFNMSKLSKLHSYRHSVLSDTKHTYFGISPLAISYVLAAFCNNMHKKWMPLMFCVSCCIGNITNKYLQNGLHAAIVLNHIKLAVTKLINTISKFKYQKFEV